MDRLKQIIVGIDFSPCSASALKQAVHIASENRTPITAIHAVSVPIVTPPEELYIPFEMPTPEAFVEAAKERWQEWGPAKEYGPGVEFKAVRGSPRSQLIEEANKTSCDLLVVGAHSGHDAKRGLGSVAAACVQRAQTKVLVVREAASEPFKSVVACIDFTEVSKYALEQAIRVAAQDNAALKVLHIYADPWSGWGPPPTVRNTLPDIDNQFRQAMEKKLHAFAKDFSHELSALKPTFHAVKTPSAGGGVIDFIVQPRCDLAVLGTRAKWNVRDFVWGTTAERIVREAPCSVLAVKIV